MQSFEDVRIRDLTFGSKFKFSFVNSLCWLYPLVLLLIFVDGDLRPTGGGAEHTGWIIGMIITPLLMGAFGSLVSATLLHIIPLGSFWGRLRTKSYLGDVFSD